MQLNGNLITNFIEYISLLKKIICNFAPKLR